MKTRKTMGRLRTSLLLAPCLCLSLPSAARSAGSAADDLTAGVRQVHEGEFDAAVVTLDGVVRRLVAEKAAANQIAKAHVYLAIAYMGLAQVEQARQRFLEALKADKTMELSPKEFPPNVIELFAQVKKEELKPPKAAPVPAATPATTPRVATVKASKGGSKLPLILLGVGAAGAGGVALAAGGGGSSTTPTPIPTPIPTPTPAPTCTAGQVQLTRAVFDPPTAVCPRTSRQERYTTNIVVDVNNTSDLAVTINSSTVNLPSWRYDLAAEPDDVTPPSAAAIAPRNLPPHSTATVTVPMSGTCTNTTSSPDKGWGWFEATATVGFSTTCGDLSKPVSGVYRLEFRW